MSTLSTKNINILFKKIWHVSGLAESISCIDRDVLCREYEELRQCAPRRHPPKRYFVDGHDGTLSTAGKSNRLEEHLAIVLWRVRGWWPSADGGRFRLLDYQFPLKARQGDTGIGKVDLLGVTERGRLMVIELKVEPKKEKSRREIPVAALMQGLRYSAIVGSNMTVIVKEAQERFGMKIVEEPPVVQILAEGGWWRRWLELEGSTRKAAGAWESEFSRLIRDVKKRLGVSVECAALADFDHTDIFYGSNGREPQIKQIPTLCPIRPGDEPAIGAALPPWEPDG